MKNQDYIPQTLQRDKNYIVCSLCLKVIVEDD